MHRQVRPRLNRDNRWVAETLSIVRVNFIRSGPGNSALIILIRSVHARVFASHLRAPIHLHTNAATAKGQIGTCVIGQVTKLNGS